MRSVGAGCAGCSRWGCGNAESLSRTQLSEMGIAGEQADLERASPMTEPVLRCESAT